MEKAGRHHNQVSRWISSVEEITFVFHLVGWIEKKTALPQYFHQIYMTKILWEPIQQTQIEKHSTRLQSSKMSRSGAGSKDWENVSDMWPDNQMGCMILEWIFLLYQPLLGQLVKLEWGYKIKLQTCNIVDILILMVALWLYRRMSLFIGNTH